MRHLTRLYGYSTTRPFIYRMYSTCNARTYLLSPFVASMIAGIYFSYRIKQHITNELLYIKCQNIKIIEKIETLEGNYK